MPIFSDPFSGNIEKRLTKEDLLQALRIDIASELEAIYLYEAHANSTNDKVVKAVLLDIANEEKEHIGELLALMRYLEPNLQDHLNEGSAEVYKMMETLKIKKAIIENSTMLTKEEAEEDINK